MQSDKVLEVRTAAAVGLGTAGDVGAVERLLKVLRTRPREDDEFLRRSAARSIGQIAQRQQAGVAQAVTPQNFLPDKFKDLGPQNVPTTPGFGSAIDVLVNVLRNGSESDDARREAAYALGAIGDAKAASALRSFTTSSDPYLAEIAREALLTIERRNKPDVSGNK
jgi:HEAT repeat protein